MLNPGAKSSSRQQQDKEELALLVSIRLGDRQAFADLYRMYQRRLFEFIRRFVNDASVIEETLDDVMLVVWKDCRKFRGDSRLSTWIFGIAYRQAMSAMKARQRRSQLVHQELDPEKIAGPGATPDDWLETALGRLSLDHRQVVVLTYFHGFSYKEIARIANCPVNTVKTRMFYARRILKSLLDDLGKPEGDKR
jgi:RNA polymerase sigma-70 factor (ECF subfamily)